MRHWRWAAGTVVCGVVAIVGIEAVPNLSGARLLECLAVAAGAAVLAWTARGALRDGLVMIASLFVGLALIEGGVLLLDAVQHKEPPAVGHDGGLSQARPLVGWGPVRPGVYRSFKTTSDGHRVFDTHVTIDAHLDRRTLSADAGRPIVFFGDSWIYGDGVEDDGTLPQLFADLNHRAFPVLNLSFAGWSPAQNLVALREGLYRKLIDKPRHFILFTSPFHLERTACKGGYIVSGAPRLVPDGDGVRYDGSCASGRGALVPLMAIAKRFALYHRLEPLLAAPRPGDVATYLKIIEAFVAEATKDYGVRTTVLFAPFDDGYLKGSGFTEARMVDAWRKAGLDVLIDRLPKIADESLYWIPGEGHPTALANKARAAEIEAHLREVDPAALEPATPP